MAQRDLQFRPLADGGLSPRGWRRRKLLEASAAALGAAMLAGPAFGQLRVDITRGRVEPVPIAISPLAGDTARDRELGLGIAEVVSADLGGSGLFRPLDRRAFIQSPDELRGLPRFPDWRQINAQALVSGLVQGGPAGLGVEFRLWDVFAGSQMGGFRYDASEAQWRRIAHKIADYVYERMTGESGYFDTRIVYISESGPETRRIKRLALMDQDGANHRFLTDGSNLVLTPQIAPDGLRVAYLEFRGLRPRVYLRNIEAGGETLLGDFSGMTFSPRFSPDGRTMLVTQALRGNSDIFRIDLASRRITQLTNDAAIDTSPSYSPDGRQIVFNSDRGGTPQLYVMGADGGGARRISYGDGRYGSPAWSPRGDLIAFTNIKRGAFHVGVMRPDGGDERLLTRSFLDQSPSWAPNGRVILFGREDQRSRRSRLFTIDITGYNERELATPMDASDPDWSPLIP
jgi:TolB protein